MKRVEDNARRNSQFGEDRRLQVRETSL